MDPPEHPPEPPREEPQDPWVVIHHQKLPIRKLALSIGRTTTPKFVCNARHSVPFRCSQPFGPKDYERTVPGLVGKPPRQSEFLATGVVR